MPAEIMSPDAEYSQESSELSPSSLAILNQSEHASMVASANLQGNRRKLQDFDNRLMAYANHSQPVALSMFYSLPRAGKQIIGASIRFAEIVAPCWKNCAVASRVVGDATDTVTAQGIFIDYEFNIRNSIEVPRRITGKDGKRFNADMIVTTSNAAMSIARRNAVLKGGVPQALWSPAYEAAQLTAVGSAVSHSRRIEDAMEYLAKLGVTELQALNAVECPSVKDLEIEHLVTLKVLCQEIKRGEKTIEQVFGSPLDKEIDALMTQLGKNATQQRFLRENYAGRTSKLLEDLRAQLTPQGPRATQSIEDRVAQSSTPAFNAREAAKEETAVGQDKPDPVAVQNVEQTQLSRATSVQETPNGEVKRGRGRPPKAETEAKRAAEAAAAGQQEQAPPPTEAVAWTGVLEPAISAVEEIESGGDGFGEHDQEDSEQSAPIQDEEEGSAFGLIPE